MIDESAEFVEDAQGEVLGVVNENDASFLRRAF